MKRLMTLFAVCAATASLSAMELVEDITHEIPVINTQELEGFKLVPNVAQYKNADWSQVVGIARGISRREAQRIAEENPDITYFFYTKGIQMVLETTDGSYRTFRHGDTVFFTGKPWWGSAPALADGYIRENLE